jgi:hypothetical protein
MLAPVMFDSCADDAAEVEDMPVTSVAEMPDPLPANNPRFIHDCGESRYEVGWVIYSGLDWSGSPGREQGPWLVFAIVHVEAPHLPTLEQELAIARGHLGRSDYVFKHQRAKSSNDVHNLFYEAIGRVPWNAHVLMLDKRAWIDRRDKRTRGIDRISDGVITLVVGCPDDVVANQVLYIDLPPAEERVIQNYRTAIRKALKGIRRTGFKNVRPCPDHRQHGTIVQVADMIAGEVREHEGLSSPFLRKLGSRVRLV